MKSGNNKVHLCTGVFFLSLSLLSVKEIVATSDCHKKESRCDKLCRNIQNCTLNGEVTGTIQNNVVSAATSENKPNLIVRRDASGSFAAFDIAAHTLVASGNINLLTEPSTPAGGTILKNGIKFISNNDESTYVGLNAGNLGMSNTGVGFEALKNNEADSTTAVGRSALSNNTTGFGNSAFGSLALLSNTTGNNNIAIGFIALANNTEARDNVAVGNLALISKGAGANNIALGHSAGIGLLSGDNNIYIGSVGGPSQESGIIRIGEHSNQNGGCFIQGIFDKNAADGEPVFVNSDGELGTSDSGLDVKYSQPLGNETEKLYSLTPLKYKNKADAEKVHYGLSPSEVYKIWPELVTKNKEGKPARVRHHMLGVLLLNEIRKQKDELKELRKQYNEIKEQLQSLKVGKHN